MEHARNVGAAVLGWVVMSALVFSQYFALWWIMGPDGSFRPGSWEVSGAWSAASVVVGIVAALIGGAVCARASADRRGVWMLVVLVVALGVFAALSELPAGVGVRPEDVSMLEAMGQARVPGWIPWLNPLIGAVGTLLGARPARGR